MNISIVVGGRFHAFDLARELLHTGYLGRLITTYPRWITRQWGFPDEKVINLALPLLLRQIAKQFGGEPLTMHLQAFLHRLFGNRAARYVEGSDVVHAWSSFAEPTMRRAKRSGVPAVLERGSAHMLEQYDLLQDEYQRLGLRWAATHPAVIAQELREYALADRVQVPSRFVERSFLDRGFPSAKLVYNPYGVNLASFTPGPKDDDTFRVVFAGSLNVRKGIHYLVRAFRLADIPRSELWLVGGATAETRLLLGEADRRVKQIGHIRQGQLAAIYQNSSVFVMASIEEGLAMVQVQALACGLPLICTTNTGGEDLLALSGASPHRSEGGVEEYPAGYVVPIRNPEAIAGLLRDLAANPRLLRQKRSAALALREQHIGWDKFAERCIAVYQTLLAAESSSAVLRGAS